METRLVEYIICIAREQSISKAAENLYITQSALNQQLLKLEKELHAPLFIRTRNHWELTDVGKLYIENAQKILQIKNDTYSQIQDMASYWNSTVKIGLTPERGIQMFTAIYPKIHEKYPETTFQPFEATVDEQERMLMSGELDISFQTIFQHNNSFLVYKPIFEEPFCLCLPKNHPLAYKETLSPEQYPEISLSEFKNDLFTLVVKTSTMRSKIDLLFHEAGFKPKLLFESTSMRTMQKLTACGQCCSIIPRYYAVHSKEISYYYLGKKASWELAAIYAHRHHLNKATRDFIQLATEYWTENQYSN